MLTKTEIAELQATHFINRIDSSLTIVSEIGMPDSSGVNDSDELVFLFLNIFYNSEKLTTMRFNLINYEFNDILYTAKNIKSNAFILKEVDDYLSGDIE